MDMAIESWRMAMGTYLLKHAFVLLYRSKRYQQSNCFQIDQCFVH